MRVHLRVEQRQIGITDKSRIGDLGEIVVGDPVFDNVSPRLLEDTVSDDEAVDLGVATDSDILGDFLLRLPGFQSTDDGDGGAPASGPCADVLATGAALAVDPRPVVLPSGTLSSSLTVTNCSAGPVDWTAATIDTVALDSAGGTLEGGAGQTLAFEDGRVHGSGGVNRFAGEYALDGDRLSLGPLAATRMAGPPEANQAELEFFAALERAVLLTVADGVLALADADGAELLRFVPGTPTEPEEATETWS